MYSHVFIFPLKQHKFSGDFPPSCLFLPTFPELPSHRRLPTSVRGYERAFSGSGVSLARPLVDNDGSATESMCLIAVKRTVARSVREQGAEREQARELSAASAAVTAFHSDN